MSVPAGRLWTMDDDASPTRQQIQDAVGPQGWRLVLGCLLTEVRVATLAEAAEVLSLAVGAVEREGQGHLSADVRGDRAVLSLVTSASDRITGLDLRLAHEVSAALGARGLHTTPGLDGSPGLLQTLEIAVDALDIPAVLPFWQAVTGYVVQVGTSNAIVDPLGRGPAIWFQQMDEPRPQRNRIHIDVSVPHEAAADRISAAVAAGGTLVGDGEAPAFWVLADAEGNEACITTWQGRD
jgi:4a-hydroxytetrahydrobiopterin dehydratase